MLFQRKHHFLARLLAVAFFCTFCLPMTLIAESDDAEQQPQLNSLELEEISFQTKLNPAFDPVVYNYDFVVPSDCYGIRVRATADEGLDIRVNDTLLPSNEDEDASSYLGEIVELSQEYEDYDRDLNTEVNVTVSDGEQETTYTINVKRPAATKQYEAFDVRVYQDSESGLSMAYQLHIPKDYDPDKAYPLIIALHGSGQMKQGIDMVLKRYALATTWTQQAEDCIVFAPHCAKPDEKDNQFETPWSTKSPDEEFLLGEAGKLAYKIVESLREEFNIDLDRQYLTGLSMGGWGVWAMIKEHPDDWAAALLSCATTWGHDEEIAKIIKQHEIPVWIYHAADDPVRSFGELEKMLAALNAVDAHYRITVYGNDRIFYPSAHFSWVPMYADEATCQWLLEQRRK